MLRIATSGCVGICSVSENVTAHFAPAVRSSPSSEDICGRLRRIRIAWPFSSGSRLTSDMIDPPWLRIGSISSGSTESNTSHAVSARRNNAAGVAVAKKNIRRRPSLSRLALTEAPLSAALACGSGSGAARVMFGGACAAAGGISFDGGAGIGVSGAGDSIGASMGLISIFACCAKLSDTGGAISPDCCDAGRGLAGFSDAPGAIAAAAPETGAAGAGAADSGAADAGATDAGACEASGVGEASAGGFSACWKADGFSPCWKATSIM